MTRTYRRLMIFSGCMQALYAARHLVVLPFLTQALGPEAYGAWSKMHAFVNLLAPMLGLGLVQAMERFIPSTDEEFQPPYFWTALSAIGISGLFLCALMPVAQPWLASLFFRDRPWEITLPILLGVAVLTITTSTTQAAQQYFRLTRCPRFYAILSTVMLFILALLAWAWWRQGFNGLRFPILLWTLAATLTGLVGLFQIAREGAAFLDKKVWGKGLRYGLPLVPATMLAWIMVFADRYMLTWLMNGAVEKTVGIYAAHYALGSVMLLAFGPLTLFFMPEFVRRWDAPDDPQHRQAWRLLHRTLCGACGVTLVIAGISWFGGEGAFQWLTGKEFTPHRGVLMLLLGGYALAGIAIFLQAPLQCRGNTLRILRHTMLAAGMNIACNLALIPRHDALGGMTGAALATLISYATLVGLHALALRTHTSEKHAKSEPA